MQDNAPIIEKVIVWAGLAGFGGAVKYLSLAMRSQDKVSRRRFLFLLGASIFISIFCGIMGGLLATAFKLDAVWQWIISGAFGYTGPMSLDIVMLSLKRKLEPGSLSAVMPVPVQGGQ